MGGLRVADRHGAHDRRVVVAVGAGEFERDLVARRERAPPGLVAAEQRVGARADDELVARIVAAAAEDRGVLGGEDVALVGAGPDMGERGGVGLVCERRGPAHMRDLVRPTSRPAGA